jgi:hypothetical protein
VAPSALRLTTCMFEAFGGPAASFGVTKTRFPAGATTQALSSPTAMVSTTSPTPSSMLVERPGAQSSRVTLLAS